MRLSLLAMAGLALLSCGRSSQERRHPKAPSAVANDLPIGLPVQDAIARLDADGYQCHFEADRIFPPKPPGVDKILVGTYIGPRSSFNTTVCVTIMVPIGDDHVCGTPDF